MANARDERQTDIEEEPADALRAIRERIEDEPDRSTDPKVGEDPGLLPLTEDPMERRQKRNTM